MDELLRAEGIPSQDIPTLCAVCGNAPGDLRCADCVGMRMLCGECMCKEHCRDALHRLQVSAFTFSLALSGNYCPPECLADQIHR